MSRELQDKLGSQYKAAQDAQTTVRSSWDDREIISLARLSNSDQNKRKSRISTGDASTIALERSGRVVAQLPTGKIRPASEMDEANASVVNLTLERYVYPNANDQFDLPTKLFLTDYLADIYGGIDVLSYWRVDDEYVGPDFQILLPRNVFWQAGKTSKSSAEYVFVSTTVSKSYLEDKKQYKTWKSDAINRVLKQVEDGAAKPTKKNDGNRISANESRQNSTASWGDTQEFELVTRYQRGKKGKWTTFLPDFDNEIVRDIPNPDPTGRIPVFRKEPLLPMIDSIYGQGSIERGESLQKGIDSTVNLTHDSLKYQLFPITKYNGSVVSRSTMKWQPGAFWNMSRLDAVETHQFNNTLNTFLPTYQFLKGALLNQNGTTDTRIAQGDAGPDYGKTPDAIKKQNQRESTFDRMSRDRFESFYSQLIEHWITLLATKQEKPIEFFIYDEEIERIKALSSSKITVAENKGAKQSADGTIQEGSAKLTLKANALKGQYRFIVDTGSSMLQDDAEQHERLSEILLTVLKIGPEQLNAALARENKEISLSGLMKRWVITGGAKDWDEIIKDISMGSMGQMPGVDQAMPQTMPQAQAPMQPMPQQMPQFSQPMPQEYTPSPDTLAALQAIEQAGGIFNGQ